MGLGNQYGVGTVAETRNGQVVVKIGPKIDDVMSFEPDSRELMPVAIYSDITVVINGGKKYPPLSSSPIFPLSNPLKGIIYLSLSLYILFVPPLPPC